MTNEERAKLIDKLDRSFQAMPLWAKTACKHAMGAPDRDPKTGERLLSFRSVIAIASDFTLETLRDDFKDKLR